LGRPDLLQIDVNTGDFQVLFLGYVNRRSAVATADVEIVLSFASVGDM
jgi:hypothetical protein